MYIKTNALLLLLIWLKFWLIIQKSNSIKKKKNKKTIFFFSSTFLPKICHTCTTFLDREDYHTSFMIRRILFLFFYFWLRFLRIIFSIEGLSRECKRLFRVTSKVLFAIVYLCIDQRLLIIMACRRHVFRLM